MSRLPPGGGRRDPRMARDLVPTLGSSYPPRLPVPPAKQKVQQRMTNGYNPNPFGQFPPQPERYSSSAPQHNDSGYERADGYPPGTPMRSQWEAYKEKGTRHATAKEDYQKEAKKRAVPKGSRQSNGVAYGGVATHYYYPEDHQAMMEKARAAKEAAREHFEARRDFSHDHVGRLTRKHYKDHRHQADGVNNSSRRFGKYEEMHEDFSEEERYPPPGYQSRSDKKRR